MVTNDLNGKPFQLKFVRAAQMQLFANAVCDPPLGSTTVVPYGETVKFTVLLESSRSFPEQPWEAILWHNGHEKREWRELRLEETQTATGPLVVGSKSRAAVYRRFFSVQLPNSPNRQAPVQFTLKYRIASSTDWKWVNENSSLTDGELYFQPEKPPAEITSYLKDLSADFSVRSVPSESPNAQVWSITTAVKAAQGETSGWTDTIIGIPRSFIRWFALVRIWSPWLAPRHGKGNFQPQEDAILCSFLRLDGLHLVLLAVSGIDDVLTVFKHDGHGNVIASSRNDSPKEGQNRIIAAVATTFESANAAVMYHARKLVRGDEYMSNEIKTEIKTAVENDVRAEWMDNWYDGLTYCTWNALGQDLNEDKIYNALNILKQNNIKITNLIIDDNWQSLDAHGEHQFNRGWTDFEANKQGFPHGLKHTITNIRDEHRNIQHIAAGYWGGVSPYGSIAKKYKTIAVRKERSLIPAETVTMVDADDIDRMYNDFYKFLLSCGVDSVKTDAQFALDLLADAPDRRRFIKAYQDAWTINSLRYFSIKAISCMSQIPQILFHTQLPTDKPRIMVRNSDDFFPGIPSSHPWHIFVNAHNSLLTSHLNILPDWDMFQTSHPYSSFHAAGRCVSGGPIYFTDEPGQHNLDLIAQMTARTIQGKTIILRPSVIGKTVGIYTGYEEERLLKVGTFAGGVGGTGILALFNVSECPLSELVNLNAFPGVESGEEYVVRTHTTGEVTHPMKLDSETPVISLEVEVKGYEILSAYPLLVLPSPETSGPDPSAAKVAVLGLLGKMTGAAAVVRSATRLEKNGRLRIELALKALGTLGIYLSTLRDKSVEDNVLVMISEKVVPARTVTIAEQAPVLELDVEAAWEEMGLEAGWSNEVRVLVLVDGHEKSSL
ncbi:MAG: hypothetical protein ASARMPREDX12_008922 [Alectoria sarmentosa]|nr:MAG: hypothetical protein ASARMPREDX12_008922 [Alectoria sarmentosa]